MEVENTIIPFKQLGSTVLFKTREPSDDKIHSLYPDRITLTSDYPWDPSSLEAPAKKLRLSTLHAKLQYVGHQDYGKWC